MKLLLNSIMAVYALAMLVAIISGYTPSPASVASAAFAGLGLATSNNIRL